MSDLPEFRPYPRGGVMNFLREVLRHESEGEGDKNYLHDLIEYPDGHYRAVFYPAFFLLPEGQTEPSKSQWNTLKKKLKRHNPKVFIFKEYGELPCGNNSPAERCYYLDFGFFAR
ncbi:MAG TPA: hypothetical protein VHO69_09035 [Phototrophicaceae bacterium]|jgi:hypothetical protein|nr:hypothetical protein [Phototrophicaceae bacterium]